MANFGLHTTICLSAKAGTPIPPWFSRSLDVDRCKPRTSPPPVAVEKPLVLVVDDEYGPWESIAFSLLMGHFVPEWRVPDAMELMLKRYS